MDEERHSRTILLLGQRNFKILRKSHVAIFGIGGVGGFATLALVRAGIGKITIVDGDVVCASDLNRQVIAFESNLGEEKVLAMKNLVLKIDSSCKVNAVKKFFGKDCARDFDFSAFDFVIDAVDDVEAKIQIILSAKSANVPLVSSMGAAGKLNPQFEIADIFETSVCPLARVMRKKLKAQNIKDVRVVFSREKSISLSQKNNFDSNFNSENLAKNFLPTISFVPASAGLLLASEAVRVLLSLQ